MLAVLHGYSSVFDATDSEGRQVARGAWSGCDFSETELWLAHQPELRVPAQLSITPDEHGLYFVAQLPHSGIGARLVAAMQLGGQFCNASFHAICAIDARSVITEAAELVEISLTREPAFDACAVRFLEPPARKASLQQRRASLDWLKLQMTLNEMVFTR